MMNALAKTFQPPDFVNDLHTACLAFAVGCPNSMVRISECFSPKLGPQKTAGFLIRGHQFPSSWLSFVETQ
jgi:hypothetical protein